MKKLFAVMLAVILTVSCFTFSSFAAGSLKVTATVSEAKAGENVSLTLELTSIPTGNVNLIHFKVTYDSSVFTLNGVNRKEAVPASSTIPSDIEITAVADGNTIDVYLINWDRIEGKGNSAFAASQNITFSFKTKIGMEGKSYSFSLTEVYHGLDAKILKDDCKVGSGVSASGKVKEAAIIRGDMDGNGMKDTADAIYLLRHTMRESKYPLDQNGDVNGDGVKNADDAIYLLRHIMRESRYPLAD